MNHVKLKRIEKFSNGTTQERTMTISQKVWDRVRKQNFPHIQWILLSNSANVKEKQLMPAKVEGAALVNYDNYSLDELKEAAKNAGIKGYAVLGKAKLIEKLTENDNSSSN